MKESYREGIANHPGPEPCEGSRKAALEALDRGTVGWVLSSEISQCEGADGVRRHGRQQRACAKSRAWRGPAESKTPGMQGNSMRENREAPPSPASGKRAGRRRR